LKKISDHSSIKEISDELSMLILIRYLVILEQMHRELDKNLEMKVLYYFSFLVFF
jgi:hypothetical protein